MAYYIPPPKKVGRHVPHQIAPMLLTVKKIEIFLGPLYHFPAFSLFIKTRCKHNLVICIPLQNYLC